MWMDEMQMSWEAGGVDSRIEKLIENGTEEEN